jgi:hypothetical protein
MINLRLPNALVPTLGNPCARQKPKRRPGSRQLKGAISRPRFCNVAYNRCRISSTPAEKPQPQFAVENRNISARLIVVSFFLA